MNIWRPAATPAELILSVHAGYTRAEPPCNQWGSLRGENIPVFTYLRSYITLSRTLRTEPSWSGAKYDSMPDNPQVAKNGEERACDADGSYS